MHPVFLPSTAADIAAMPPLMPMATSLKLSRNNEDTLVTHALDRLGWKNGRMESPSVDKAAWMEPRKNATAQFEGDFTFRKAVGSIFELSNRSLNVVKRVIRTIAARIMDDLVGSRPFLGIGTEGPEDDPKLAKNVERFAHHTADEAGAPAELRMAGRAAFIRGEAVVKRRWHSSSCRWREMEEVAYTADGRVITDSKGQPVTRSDEFAPHPSLEAAVVLEREPAVILLPDTKWMLALVQRSEEESRAELRLVWFEDFHCDTTARGIQRGDTDFIAQTSDCPVHVLQDMLRGAANKDAAEKLLAQVRDFDQQHASAGSEPNTARGEESRTTDNGSVAALVECYLTLDADGDGFAEEIVLIIERETRMPVFYDYLQNVCPDHRRPYEVIRPFPVENRWYGFGLYDLHKGLNEFIEIIFNRINIQGLKSGRIDFSNPDACKETAAGEKIQFGTDKVYTLKDGFTKDDAYSFVAIPNLDEKAYGLLQLCLQAIQLESGQITAGEGDASGMPSTELATGIRSLERQANTLLKEMLLNVAEGVERTMQGLLAYAIHYMDEQVTFSLMEGDAQQVVELKREDVRTLKYKLRLILSGSPGEDRVALSKEAKATVIEYLSLLPEHQVAVRDFYVEILKGLKVQNVEKALPLPVLIQPTTDPNGNIIQAPPMGGPAGAGSQQPPAAAPQPAGLRDAA